MPSTLCTIVAILRPRRIAAMGVLLALLGVPAGPAGAEASAPCRPQAFQGNDYTVCTIDLRTHRLRLFWKDDRGVPYGAFRRLPAQVDGTPLVFAMNAGMYHADLSPVGLHIEDGDKLMPANTRDGRGNFHLKPNGIFFARGQKAGVLATERYLAQRPQADIASQSGPMLVIDGRIHPRFLRDSTSRKRRNGVGVRDPHTVVFAISEGTVTFWEFAHLFRDGLGSANALYLDGTMSSLHAPHLRRSDVIRPMGPMIAAFPRN